MNPLTLRAFAIRVTISTVLLAIVLPAHSEWYVSSEARSSETPLNLRKFDLNSLNSDNFNNAEPSVSLFGGYRPSDNFAVELGYADTAEQDFDTVEVGKSFRAPGTITKDIDGDSVFLSGIGSVNVNDNSSLYLKAGLYNWTLSTSLSQLSDSDSASQKRNGTDVFYGLGAKFDITSTFGIRAGWERYEFNDGDVDFLSTEFNFEF